MKAIILAAGQGKRMEINEPKCLIGFGDVSLLDRQVMLFRKLGINNITVVVGYKPEKIKPIFCGKIINREYSKTNMAYSLFLTQGIWTEDIIVSYGDIIYEEGLLNKIMMAKDDINVMVDTNGVQYFKDRFGENYKAHLESLAIEKNNHIIDIGRSFAEADIENCDGQYIGLLKFKLKGLRMLLTTYWKNEDKYKNAYMTTILNDMIENGHTINAVKTDGGWLEFDTQEDISTYQEWYEKGKLRKYYMEVL